MRLNALCLISSLAALAIPLPAGAVTARSAAAKILIDPFLSDNPSWHKGWIGSRAGEDSIRGGGR